jgi:polyhydroxybutyrate depolymerase
VTISFGGVARDYVLYVPASYTGDRPVPVVFDFHGYGSSAVQQMAYGDFRALANRDGFLIVAPDGVGDGGNRHFNFGVQPSAGDDVAFTLAILDQVEGRYCVEARRVYAAGMSDGGAMTSGLACRAADRFAAFGPVAVVLYSPLCAPGRPVAIAAFMGTADPVVPFNGGNVHCCGSPFVPSAPGSMSGWAVHDGCAAQPVDRQLSSQVVLRQWSACAAGSDVRFYMIQGGGHTWPGTAYALPILGLTTTQVNASDTLWAFFQAHPLPG